MQALTISFIIPKVRQDCLICNASLLQRKAAGYRKVQTLAQQYIFDVTQTFFFACDFVSWYAGALQSLPLC